MTRVKIGEAVVDSSALISILTNEPAAPHFHRELKKVDALYMSAVTRAEVFLGALGKKGAAGAQSMEALIKALNIRIVDFTAQDIPDFEQASLDHHLKGTSKIKGALTLNMGDIYPFILARKMDIPLFFQGKDFLATPVKNAMRMLGYEMTDANQGVPTPAPTLSR